MHYSYYNDVGGFASIDLNTHEEAHAWFMSLVNKNRDKAKKHTLGCDDGTTYNPIAVFEDN